MAKPSKIVKPTRSPKIVEIDADQWAESGGTAGPFGKNWKNGTLRIVSEDGSGNPVVVRKANGDA